MALPAGFLDDLKNRLSLSQIVGRKVIWDTRKSNPAKGDHWSPCPFHQEKTASFHVDDQKGFYYCFGCHAKGDALSFVRETENVSFMEAVEILANEAGMTVPAQDPRAREQEKVRATLFDVMELAIKFYRMQFNAAQASEARAYIEKRGLSTEDIKTFEIGFAPNGRTALIDHLKAKNVTTQQMIETGLVIAPDDGGAPFDRFRDRIMFPIRDGRNRATAFGGRAMSANAKAKYLNSPETNLFDKGRSLYNHARAREAAGKAQSLIVAEGYMDVVALHKFGFEHTVAPLGTAITADQLQLMWRISEEPIIALDGDKAGLRAAMRLIDVALPLLSAGKSLRFALMPAGLDPDDLLKSGGQTAMAKLLQDAIPMAALLWQRETADKDFDSPERRASLDASLKKSLDLIQDSSIRDHYRHDFRQRRAELFAPHKQVKTISNWSAKGQRPKAPAQPSAGAKSSYLARAEAISNADARVRELSILQGFLQHPAAISHLEDDLESLPLIHGDLATLRDAILAAAQAIGNDRTQDDGASPTEFQSRVEACLRTGSGAEKQLPESFSSRVRMRSLNSLETALQSLRSDMARHRAIIGRVSETREAEDEISGVDDEGLTWRLLEAERSLEEASRLEDLDSSGLHSDRENNLRNLDMILAETGNKGKKR